MSELFQLSPAWLDGLDHAQIGALTLLLSAAAEAEPRGCLPDDDACLAEAAGYGVQLRAWRRVKAAVLAGWRRVADPAEPARVLLLFPGMADAALLQAAPVPAAMSADEKRRFRDRMKKRRQRARARLARAAAARAEGDAAPSASPSAVPLSPRPVPPASPLCPPAASPGLSPGLSPAAAEMARNQAFAAAVACARDAWPREASPSAVPLSPPDGGRVAPARVEDSPSTISPVTTISTTTTVENLAGADAREADGKVVVVGGANIAALQDQAAARVVAAFHDARRARWGEGVARPSKPDATLRSIVMQWFADGASETLLVQAIRANMQTLHTPPNTLWAFKHSVAAAIAEARRLAAQPALALTQQVEGAGLRMRDSLRPCLKALLEAGIGANQLRSWFADVELARDGAAVVLVAPMKFTAGEIRRKFAAPLDAVFGAGRWRVEVDGRQKAVGEQA